MVIYENKCHSIAISITDCFLFEIFTFDGSTARPNIYQLRIYDPNLSYAKARVNSPYKNWHCSRNPWLALIVERGGGVGERIAEQSIKSLILASLYTRSVTMAAHPRSKALWRRIRNVFQLERYLVADPRRMERNQRDGRTVGAELF